MAVLTKYFSDKDPETMFDDLAAAQAHDAKLEREENLAVLLEDAAKGAGIALPSDDAHKLAQSLIENHAEQLGEIMAPKKVRKPREKKTECSE
jgi:dsDNA-binding SOS-regulon protein